MIVLSISNYLSKKYLTNANIYIYMFMREILLQLEYYHVASISFQS